MYQQPLPPAPPTLAPVPPPGSGPLTDQRRRGPRLAVLVIAALLVAMLAVSTVSGAVGKARVLAYPKPSLGQISFDNSSGRDTIRSGDTLVFSVAVLAGHDLTYRWNFGDGAAGTGAHPSHTFYRYAEQLEVSVQVSDPLGQTAGTLPLALRVLPPPPTAAFTIDYAYSYCFYYCTIYVDASYSSAGAPGIEISYNWQWGDGYSEDDDTYPQTYHDYDQAGTYTITLTVTDQFGQSSSTSQPFTISS